MRSGTEACLTRDPDPTAPRTLHTVSPQSSRRDCRARQTNLIPGELCDEKLLLALRVKREPELLSSVQHPDGLQDNVAGNLQTLRAKLVESVLWGVMKNIFVTVVEVNQVSGGDADLQKRQMVIIDFDLSPEEV